MPKARALARISMTIPADLLKRADKLAKAWERSRSWVLAEGIKRLSEPPPRATSDQRLDESRRQQLQADLKLTTEQRVVAAERTAREAPTRSFGRLFVTFDRPEDYLEWKRLEAMGLV